MVQCQCKQVLKAFCLNNLQSPWKLAKVANDDREEKQHVRCTHRLDLCHLLLLFIQVVRVHVLCVRAVEDENKPSLNYAKHTE